MGIKSCRFSPITFEDIIYFTITDRFSLPAGSMRMRTVTIIKAITVGILPASSARFPMNEIRVQCWRCL